MQIDPAYEGRKHSLIKPELLKGYLEVLLSIVGISGVKEFTYVDCFAGLWGDESESLSGTSIAISLEILAKVRKEFIRKFCNEGGVEFSHEDYCAAEAVCWTPGRTIGNIAVSSEEVFGMFDGKIGDDAILPCHIIPCGKFRNGAQRWYVRACYLQRRRTKSNDSME